MAVMPAKRLKSTFDWSIGKDWNPVDGARASARLRALAAGEVELARCNDCLKNNRAELRKAERQFGAALVKLVRTDPDFAAELLLMLRRRGKLRGKEGA